MSTIEGVIDLYTCTRTNSGEINLLEYLDCYSNWHNVGRTVYSEVLKSAMHSREYYAAVRETNKENNTVKVYAVIGKVEFLRKKNKRGSRYRYFSFTYFTEDFNPRWHNCPKSILKVLEEPNSDNARLWRQACLQTAEKKHDMFSVMNLPIGSIVEVMLKQGETYETQQFELKEEAFQFRRSWWCRIDTDVNQYCPKKMMKRLEELGRIRVMRYGSGAD